MIVEDQLAGVLSAQDVSDLLSLRDARAQHRAVKRPPRPFATPDEFWDRLSLPDVESFVSCPNDDDHAMPIGGECSACGCLDPR